MPEPLNKISTVIPAPMQENFSNRTTNTKDTVFRPSGGGCGALPLGSPTRRRGLATAPPLRRNFEKISTGSKVTASFVYQELTGPEEIGWEAFFSRHAAPTRPDGTRDDGTHHTCKKFLSKKKSVQNWLIRRENLKKKVEKFPPPELKKT